MEETENVCDFVCSEEFKCHWEKLEQKVRYLFPDGTTQTCVGAQVRCGCSFYMKLISNVTYEHPTAVSLSFLFISTIICYLLLRRLVLKQKCLPNFAKYRSRGSQSQSAPEVLPSPRNAVLEALRQNGSIPSSSSTSTQANPQEIAAALSTVGGRGSSGSCSIYIIDKPPAYSKYDESSPPPSYDECLKSSEPPLKILTKY